MLAWAAAAAAVRDQPQSAGNIARGMAAIRGDAMICTLLE
jgi:hypothetical protein